MSDNADQYGYIPSLPASIFGCVLFGLTTVVAFIQIFAYRFQHKWISVLFIASFGETVGWAGRLWAHFSVCMTLPNSKSTTELKSNLACRFYRLQHTNLQSYRQPCLFVSRALRSFL